MIDVLKIALNVVGFIFVLASLVSDDTNSRIQKLQMGVLFFIWCDVM
jgi:hypothetical protein